MSNINNLIPMNKRTKDEQRKIALGLIKSAESGNIKAFETIMNMIGKDT